MLKYSFGKNGVRRDWGLAHREDPCRDGAKKGGRLVLTKPGVSIGREYRCAVSSPGSKDVTAASGKGQNCSPMFTAHNGLVRYL